MDFLSTYAVWMIPIIVGIIVQAIKFAIYSFKHGWDFHYAFTHGHMPSAHTALAFSLITSVGYYEGLSDASFAIAIVLAFIIVDDAARLRMHLGDQGRYLNMLVQKLVEQADVDEKKFPRLKERTGHRVSEVIVGAILGILLSLLFIWIVGQPPHSIN